MLVLEGPDCSGKTTLAKMIVERFNCPFSHLGLPPVGLRHWDLVKAALKANPVNTVYDRMVIGSLIFGNVKPDEHNRNSVTEAEFERWTRLLNALRSTLILCVADEDTLLERFRARGDDYLNEDELLASAAAYRNITHRITRNKLVTNTLVYNSQYATPEVFIQGNERAIYRAVYQGHTPTKADLSNINRYMY